MTKSDGQYTAMNEMVPVCFREEVHGFRGENRFVADFGGN
jgi:hypothetical protein